MRQIIKDKEFGDIYIRINSRTSKLIAHAKDGAIWVTTPPYVMRSNIIEMINQHREQLRKIVSKARLNTIDINFKIETELFKLHLHYSETGKFRALYPKVGEMEIECPESLDFAKPDVQALLRKAIVEKMRSDAKIIVPRRLRVLSEQCGLPFSSVKISSSRGRWGSCSSAKAINISLYSLLLPLHLMDYVLLHELCHTREMNHSDAFWALLDSFTGNKARDLRDELKDFQTSF